MDKSIANLILEQGENIFPFLKLVSYHALNGEVTKEKAISLVSDETFSLLCSSGFVSLDGECVNFKDGDRWLFDIPPALRRPKSISNFDKQLDRIAELAGFPVDFYQKKGKYRTLYRRLYDEYGFDEIETIAYDNRGIGLALLLTKRTFESLRAKFEAESR